MTPNVSRTAAGAGVALLALCALVSLIVIARGGELEDTDWKLLGTLVAGLFCGSAALTALRFAIPYRVLAAVPLGAFALLAIAVWSDEVWDERAETMAKAVLSSLALTLAVLLIASLRLQTPFTSAQVWIAFIAVSGVIAVTTLLALGLLWSWNAPFIDDAGGSERGENVANIAQRILLALVTLSVLAYLALPLVTRFLTTKTERDH